MCRAVVFIHYKYYFKFLVIITYTDVSEQKLNFECNYTAVTLFFNLPINGLIKVVENWYEVVYNSRNMDSP